MTPPQDLTTEALKVAKSAELKKWIRDANDHAKKHVMNTTGKVQELRQRLADYYLLDLSAPEPVPVAPTEDTNPINITIQNRQWDYLMELGAEWKKLLVAGQEFKLLRVASPALNPSRLPHDLQEQVKSILQTAQINGRLERAQHHAQLDNETGVPPGGLDADPETVSVWIQSAQSNEGDMEALTSLFRLQSIMGSPVVPTSATPTSLSAPSFHSPIPAMLPATPTRNHHEATADTAVLSAGSLDIDALERVEGLREVIQQVECGDVAKFRAQYGPQTGRKADPRWRRIKNSISRRERLANELERQFGGDKERFFSFFAVPDNISTGTKRKKRSSGLRPYRRVAEAISHRDKDLKDEKQKVEYIGMDGRFSQELWTQKWSTLNDWEVWRALGKERY